MSGCRLPVFTNTAIKVGHGNHTNEFTKYRDTMIHDSYRQYYYPGVTIRPINIYVSMLMVSRLQTWYMYRSSFHNSILQPISSRFRDLGPVLIVFFCLVERLHVYTHVCATGLIDLLVIAKLLHAESAENGYLHIIRYRPRNLSSALIQFFY